MLTQPGATTRTIPGAGVAASPRVLLLLAAASWGVGTVVSKRAVAEIPPFELLSLQLAASLVALWATVRVAGRRPAGTTVPPVLARLGLLNPGLAYALGLIGLTQISASLSVVLWAVEPIVIGALAAFALRERIGPAFVALSALAALGVALVAYEPGLGGSALGIIATLAGIACCAVYTVAVRRLLPDAPDSVAVVVSQQAHALAVAVGGLVLVLALGLASLPAMPSTLGLASGVLSGLLYYAAAYVLYLGALRVLPAASAASSFYLIPLFGVAAAVALLGERLTAVQWLGALIVIAAVFLILRQNAVRSVSARASTPA